MFDISVGEQNLNFPLLSSKSYRLSVSLKVELAKMFSSRLNSTRKKIRKARLNLIRYENELARSGEIKSSAIPKLPLPPLLSLPALSPSNHEATIEKGDPIEMLVIY